MALDSVYETDNSYYLLLELFSGGNLKEMLKKEGHLNERKAAFIMRQVLKALQHLHKNKIIHRDIKPDNILFRQSDIFRDQKQVAIADFGLSTFSDSEQLLYPKCGTPGFAAPEVINYKKGTERYSNKCDLYSFGVTLYYVLTTRLPYQGKKDLIDENKDGNIDLNKSEIFATLTPAGFPLNCIVQINSFNSQRSSFKTDMRP